MLLKSVVECEVAANHDVLCFWLHTVKGDIVGTDPLQSLRESVSHPSASRFWEDTKRFGLDLTYGSSLNLRRDLDTQILSRVETGVKPYVLGIEIEQVMGKVFFPSHPLLLVILLQHIVALSKLLINIEGLMWFPIEKGCPICTSLAHLPWTNRDNHMKCHEIQKLLDH
ncbi:hypothetical protein ZIOFF_067387 [Zingiber officinale]|uniref:Uncharacterized protein n=1 Tax=Zingiber officinale TaxID=94328 RepID=A0A8J5CD87_ZINOF|nr:hypothetical protein ZIOFF_067387 [Zingiber officinale]